MTRHASRRSARSAASNALMRTGSWALAVAWLRRRHMDTHACMGTHTHMWTHLDGVVEARYCVGRRLDRAIFHRRIPRAVAVSRAQVDEACEPLQADVGIIGHGLERSDDNPRGHQAARTPRAADARGTGRARAYSTPRLDERFSVVSRCPGSAAPPPAS